MQMVCKGPGCGESFEAKRASAKFCSARCRVRANRAPDRGEVDPSNVVQLPGATDDGAITRATRTELVAAGVLSSALGQSAILAAQRLDEMGRSESGAGVRALLEGHRAALAEAVRGAQSDEVNPLELIRASAALKLLKSG